MGLLLNGAKTATIAGTEMDCIEIYAGESYTLPLAFTNSGGTPLNCTGWTMATAAKWYTCTAVDTPGVSSSVTLSGITLISPQPAAVSTSLGVFTTPATGIGYLYLPSTLSGSTAPTTPTLTDITTLLCIMTLTVTRTDPLSGLSDVNREPIGLLIRYL